MISPKGKARLRTIFAFDEGLSNPRPLWIRVFHGLVTDVAVGFMNGSNFKHAAVNSVKYLQME